MLVRVEITDNLDNGTFVVDCTDEESLCGILHRTTASENETNTFERRVAKIRDEEKMLAAKKLMLPRSDTKVRRDFHCVGKHHRQDLDSPDNMTEEGRHECSNGTEWTRRCQRGASEMRASRCTRPNWNAKRYTGGMGTAAGHWQERRQRTREGGKGG